jgi:hypothetical protein
LQSRVVLTAGGESKTVACTDLEATLTDLDPATTQAFGRLLDVSGIEINRVTVQLGAPTNRLHEVAFPFTLPLAFGAYRVTVLWTVAGTLATQSNCDLVGASSMHVTLGPRAPVDVPCSTGFYQFYNVGGTLPVTADLRSAAGALIESKTSTVTISDNTQLTYNYAESLAPTTGSLKASFTIDGSAASSQCAAVGATDVAVYVDGVLSTTVACASGEALLNNLTPALHTIEVRLLAGSEQRNTQSTQVSVTAGAQALASFNFSGCANGCVAGQINLDGNAATGACGCEYICTPTSASDPVDAGVVDANCDGSDWVIADCLYVDNTLLLSGVGTTAAPFNTIADALGPAGPSGNKHSICVAAGTYTGTVALPPGTNLIGGFDRDAGYRRSASAVTTISAPGTAITVLGTAANTTIAGLNIVATNAGLPAGASVYGVRVNLTGSAPLVIAYCSIDTDDALAGAAGAAGADGASGGVGNDAAGSNGATAPICGMTLPVGTQGQGGDGVSFAAGGDGFDGVTGAASGNGASACGAPGGAGALGVTGASGADAAQPTGAPSLNPTTGAYQGVNGLSGTGGSRGSYGGGGGAGGASAGVCIVSDIGGGGGSGGCGGEGGGSGAPGNAGGAAIGVVVVNGAVTLDHCTITPGAGGAGGNGGLGGAGGDGGAGGQPDASLAGAGGDGGIGGAGGRGGRGSHASGGLGGPSACYARGTGLGTGVVTTASVSCTAGAAGLGGTLGGPSGARSATGFTGEALDLDAVP